MREKEENVKEARRGEGGLSPHTQQGKAGRSQMGAMQVL